MSIIVFPFLDNAIHRLLQKISNFYFTSLMRNSYALSQNEKLSFFDIMLFFEKKAFIYNTKPQKETFAY